MPDPLAGGSGALAQASGWRGGDELQEAAFARDLRAELSSSVATLNDELATRFGQFRSLHSVRIRPFH
jgi:hypothetical protein